MTHLIQLLSRRGRAAVGTVAALALVAIAIANITGRAEVTEMASDDLKVSVVYDNYLVESGLGTGWGYAAVVEFRGQTILFDTGADGPTLMANLRALGFDPHKIEAVVLSHAHGDHTLGLDSLLATGVRPKVYVLPSFPADFKRHVAQSVEVIEVEPGQVIGDGLFTTGEMTGPVNEQALVVESARGLVIVTGCAHPGVVEIVSQAKNIGDKNVHLVTGGFHLVRTSAERIGEIVAEFRRLGVEKAAPSHCSGDAAIGAFREEYGDDFVQSGVGRVFEIPS
jgi:7,8-dihydropterin-6-yl-methyl-4-(beta-D-ribofuranosyl)aminobenzene 5'-phosphate synthase